MREHVPLEPADDSVRRPPWGMGSGSAAPVRPDSRAGDRPPLAACPGDTVQPGRERGRLRRPRNRLRTSERMSYIGDGRRGRKMGEGNQDVRAGNFLLLSPSPSPLLPSPFSLLRLLSPSPFLLSTPFSPLVPHRSALGFPVLRPEKRRPPRSVKHWNFLPSCIGHRRPPRWAIGIFRLDDYDEQPPLYTRPLRRGHRTSPEKHRALPQSV